MFKSHKSIVLIFFILFLGVGLFLVKDYGVSWDEGEQRAIGIISFNYVIKGDQHLLQFRDRAYGPFFEVILVALEKGLHLSNNIRAVYLMRHLATFLFFYLGVIFFYKLCKKIFLSWRMALLGCLFLILSPRIFADAFYNSKDIPCLSLFIISTYTLINYLENQTFVNAFIHAFFCAMLIDTRIVGIIIPAMTLLFAKLSHKKDIKSFFAYCLFLIVLIVLFWPFLWPSPLNNFKYALSYMSRFGFDDTVLYLGQYIKANHLPWHYIPVWIAISTPLVYVGAFCIGYVKIIVSAGRNFPQFYRNNKSELIILLLISLPILAVILLKSPVYNAWRHMFFVYPAFLIVSLIGLRALFGFVREKPGAVFIQTILILLILFNLSNVVLFMVRNHPYQNLYFNRLAGRNMKEIKGKFEMDYWGLSYINALKHIIASDPGRVIKIYVNDLPGRVDTGMLNDNDKKRLEFVDDFKQAKYSLSTDQWYDNKYQNKNEYYSIKVDGAAMVVVYRL